MHFGKKMILLGSSNIQKYLRFYYHIFIINLSLQWPKTPGMKENWISYLLVFSFDISTDARESSRGWQSFPSRGRPISNALKGTE